MIASLTGLIQEKNPPKLILDVRGVGYEIFVPLSIYKTLPSVGEEHSLKIKYVQKEDSTTLYGFNSYDEKNLFETLISVKGIGDKSILKYLNQEKAEDIIEWIATENIDALIKLPTLGKKTAAKLLLDLKGKLISNHDDTIYDEDALYSLISLGFTEKAAKTEIKRILTSNMSTREIIKTVLANGS